MKQKIKKKKYIFEAKTIRLRFGNTDSVVKDINLELVLDIRRDVLWPKKKLDYIKLEEDNSKNMSHLALYVNDIPVSIVSVFVNEKKMQFRKFATKLEYQGNGYGTKLLKYIFKLAKNDGIEYIWCNARKELTKYYNKFGLLETDKTFKNGEQEIVVMAKY